MSNQYIRCEHEEDDVHPSSAQHRLHILACSLHWLPHFVNPAQRPASREWRHEPLIDVNIEAFAREWVVCWFVCLKTGVIKIAAFHLSHTSSQYLSLVAIALYNSVFVFTILDHRVVPFITRLKSRLPRTHIAFSTPFCVFDRQSVPQTTKLLSTCQSFSECVLFVFAASSSKLRFASWLTQQRMLQRLHGEQWCFFPNKPDGPHTSYVKWVPF